MVDCCICCYIVAQIRTWNIYVEAWWLCTPAGTCICVLCGE
jgi:hypothetical protein